MPPGPPKGTRIGGRQKGTPNKVTLERAAAIKEQAKASGHAVAIDELRELARYHKGMGAKYQPQFVKLKDEKGQDVLDTKGQPVLQQAGGSEDRSDKHLGSAERILIALLPYETPKLQSTTIRSDAPEEPIKVQIEIV